MQYNRKKQFRQKLKCTQVNLGLFRSGYVLIGSIWLGLIRCRTIEETQTIKQFEKNKRTRRMIKESYQKRIDNFGKVGQISLARTANQNTCKILREVCSKLPPPPHQITKYFWPK